MSKLISIALNHVRLDGNPTGVFETMNNLVTSTLIPVTMLMDNGPSVVDNGDVVGHDEREATPSNTTLPLAVAYENREVLILVWLAL
ncbi:hypothetical protein IEQ34_007304 [Dendrobium chrysotoxum]|uniref:Uncharacterized protein n=1 Tax=Dendrobium chrysotoxum TaxID=161865 RepID=A0AAV7H951_DENCH|nr:hypothetical protein IEQ34_007304 [Dendrobium chrysotoxum]